MIAQTPWIERKFNFYEPIGTFPCVFERLVGTPARLEEMVKELSEDILTKKINGKWSIKEQAGHLADLDELHDGRLDDFYEGKEMLRVADMSNQKTSDANHNLRTIEDLLHEFREKRMKFANRLKDLNEEMLITTSVHPRLKIPMRLIDMVLFICEHDDHHLAKIRRIIDLK